MGRAENYVERYLIARVQELGGDTRKVVYQGRKGSPDRWCFLPGGKLVIVECKSSVGQLSRQQAREIEWLTEIGQKVYVAYTREQVDEILSVAL